MFDKWREFARSVARDNWVFSFDKILRGIWVNLGVLVIHLLRNWISGILQTMHVIGTIGYIIISMNNNYMNSMKNKEYTNYAFYWDNLYKLVCLGSVIIIVYASVRRAIDTRILTFWRLCTSVHLTLCSDLSVYIGDRCGFYARQHPNSIFSFAAIKHTNKKRVTRPISHYTDVTAQSTKTNRIGIGLYM